MHGERGAPRAVTILRCSRIPAPASGLRTDRSAGRGADRGVHPVAVARATAASIAGSASVSPARAATIC
jgi:hypothetical protein